MILTLNWNIGLTMASNLVEIQRKNHKQRKKMRKRKRKFEVKP